MRFDELGAVLKLAGNPGRSREVQGGPGQSCTILKFYSGEGANPNREGKKPSPVFREWARAIGVAASCVLASFPGAATLWTRKHESHFGFFVDCLISVLPLIKPMLQLGHDNNTNESKTMHYPLNPAQKTILAAAGENVNFKGDDNDLGCLMSQIALKYFMAGETTKAWDCYQNDPGACYGVTFAAWESDMKSMVIRHMENERAMKAHSVAMGNAG